MLGVPQVPLRGCQPGARLFCWASGSFRLQAGTVEFLRGETGTSTSSLPASHVLVDSCRSVEKGRCAEDQSPCRFRHVPHDGQKHHSVRVLRPQATQKCTASAAAAGG